MSTTFNSSLGIHAEPKVADAVRAAIGAGPRIRPVVTDLTTSPAVHRVAAVILGIYLTFNVARAQEVFLVLAVPRLPMLMLLAILLLTAAGMPLSQWRTIWETSLPMRLMTIFVGLVVVTAPIGIYVMGSVEYILNRYIVTVLVFYAALLLCRDRRNLRIVISILVTGVAILTIWGLTHPQPWLDEDGDPRILDDGTYRMERMGLGGSLDPNDFSAVLVAAVPLAIYAGIGGPFRRIFFWGIAMILVGGVVPTGSRGGMLGLVAVALVLISQGASWWRKILLGGMVIVGAVLFAATASDEMGARFLSIGADDYNVTASEGRIGIWKRGLVWMTWRPWGMGIGNFPVHFGWLNGPERAAHNSFIQIGTEIGVAGLAVFCYLVWVLIRGAARQRRYAASLIKHLPRGKIRRQADTEAWLGGCSAAMLAGTMTTGFFLSNAYYGLMYMALGIGAAVLLGFPYAEQLAPKPAAEPPALPNRLPRRPSHRRGT